MRTFFIAVSSPAARRVGSARNPGEFCQQFDDSALRVEPISGGGGGTAARRRRRRVREALEAVAGEEGIGNADVLAGGAVRRRRARSAGFASAGGACVVM